MSGPHEAEPRATSSQSGASALVLVSRQDEEGAFDAYWQALLRQSPALKAMRDHHAVRGLNLRDFREALHDAFTAGRDSANAE